MRILITLIFSSLLVGCGVSGSRLFSHIPTDPTQNSSTQTDAKEITFFGPEPVFDREKIEPINLFNMMDPESKSRIKYKKMRDDIASAPKESSPPREWKELTIAEKYEYGFHAFYEDKKDIEKKRNRIQDRIIAASEQRCSLYKKLLQQNHSDQNFYFGSAATIFGVLGPLFGERGAQNLAAMAGLSSGIRAEYNQSYFSNLAVNVVVSGIEERRRAIQWRIAEAQKETIDNYTLQAAIRDTIYLDGECSLVAGMEEAQAAIKLTADPGIDAATKIVAKLKLAGKIANAQNETDAKVLSDLLNAHNNMSGGAIINASRFSNVGTISSNQHKKSLFEKIYETAFSSKAIINALQSDQKTNITPECNELLKSFEGKINKKINETTPDDQVRHLELTSLIKKTPKQSEELFNLEEKISNILSTLKIYSDYLSKEELLPNMCNHDK